ncbi:MAG TPA: hypothetical protein VN696_01000, partial [Pyrinomonadaceae bacterium]|nr:hypothetical protein [Pyrinomonadaceae bacterium]
PDVSTTADVDEFVEVYNNTDSPITVSTSDGSAGWTLVASSGTELCRINNATVLPARGHYLCTNTGGYSLNGYAVGDTGWSGADIPSAGGVALFRTNNPVNYTLSERLDAAGYAGVNALYREGNGFPTGGGETTGNLDYTIVRSMTRTTGGLPRDTGDNVSDFMMVNTAGASTGMGAILGAPGPENLSSPIHRNSQFATLLLDPLTSSAAPPNRARDYTAVTNGTLGTLLVRRTFTNNTGASVTRLRFRIVEFTTLTTPPVAGQADLRALNSSDGTVMVNGSPVTVRGLTLEQPPTQPNGGGWNSSMNTGFINLASPLANGNSVNVEFRLGVMAGGRFTLLVNIEATTSIAPPP